MNKFSRLNYLKSISHNVERKKMYKAKKQWIVAGLSFLVTAGVGLISSHVSTHAQEVQSNRVSMQEPKSNNVMMRAKVLSSRLMSNATHKSGNSSLSSLSTREINAKKQSNLLSSMNKVSNSSASSSQLRRINYHKGLMLDASNAVGLQTVNYENVKNSNSIVGSYIASGNFGNSFDASHNVPSGYQLIPSDGSVKPGQSFSKGKITSNGPWACYVEPASNSNTNSSNPFENEDQDTLDFDYNGSLVASSVAVGDAGSDATATAPSGYKLNSDSYGNYKFDNGTHTISVAPISSANSNSTNTTNNTNNTTDNNKDNNSTNTNNSDKTSGYEYIIYNGDSDADSVANGTYGSTSSVSAPSDYQFDNNENGSFTFSDATKTFDVSPSSTTNQSDNVQSPSDLNNSDVQSDSDNQNTGNNSLSDTINNGSDTLNSLSNSADSVINLSSNTSSDNNNSNGIVQMPQQSSSDKESVSDNNPSDNNSDNEYANYYPNYHSDSYSVNNGELLNHSKHNNRYHKRISRIRKKFSWIKLSHSKKGYKSLFKVGKKAKSIKLHKKTIAKLINAYKIHGKHHSYLRYEIKIKGHKLYISASGVHNAYLAYSHKYIGKHVKVLHGHKNKILRIKRIKKVGHHEITKIKLSNGKWINANLKYIKIL